MGGGRQNNWVMGLVENFSGLLLEAGCDEAGRGCLAGPVVAAAVILNPEKPILGLNDSKKLTEVLLLHFLYLRYNLDLRMLFEKYHGFNLYEENNYYTLLIFLLQIEC